MILEIKKASSNTRPLDDKSPASRIKIVEAKLGRLERVILAPFASCRATRSNLKTNPTQALLKITMIEATCVRTCTFGLVPSVGESISEQLNADTIGSTSGSDTQVIQREASSE